MHKVEYYSASSLGTYDTCPYRWWLNYVKKLKQLDNPAFIIGTAYHKSLELFYGGMSKEQVLEELKQQFIGSKEGIDQLGIVRQCFNKHQEYPIDLPVVSLEYKFDFVDPVTGLRFLGYIDRLAENAVIEYKTSAFDYKDKDINEIQVVLYALAFLFRVGRLPDVVYLSVMNKKKAKKDNYVPQMIPVKVGQEHIDRFYLKATSIADKIEQEKFDATPGVHCYYCPFGKKGTNNCKFSR